ncbi:VOC family protein [Micropruina sonneratiae]|uniref:VOC family protein n=1 Tax=Micropruina sonneratiae TaxID=2986940 RepID=UPI003CC80F31
MTSRVSHTSVDCADAYELSQWWKRVLDYHDVADDPNEPGHEECMLLSPDESHRLLFIEVPEAKAVKNRLHLDLVPTDRPRDAEVERLLGLGATRVADRRGTTDRAPAGWCWPTRRATSSASCARTPSGVDGVAQSDRFPAARVSVYMVAA